MDLSRVKAQVLAIVAWADGSFSDKEQEVFIDVLNHSGLDEDTRLELVDYIYNPPDKDEALQNLSKVGFDDVEEVIRVAFAVARADGTFHEAERKVIDEMFDRFGIHGRDRELHYEAFITASGRFRTAMGS